MNVKMLKLVVTTIGLVGAASIFPISVAFADSGTLGSRGTTIGHDNKSRESAAVTPNLYGAGALDVISYNMGNSTMEIAWTATSYVGAITRVNMMTEWDDSSYWPDSYSTAPLTQQGNSHQHKFNDGGRNATHEGWVSGVVTINYGLDAITFGDCTTVCDISGGPLPNPNIVSTGTAN